ncbi:MAG: hypothetical protein GDA39_02375, partial [Hyphomonadaceae bacterium]|nr:hypothetical protein [Hyphomonadaceae bacterium]
MGRISFRDVAGEAIRRGYRRLATDLGGPLRSLNLRSHAIGQFRDIQITNFSGRKATHDRLLNGHFIYAGQELDIGTQGDPWIIQAPSEHFAFWLHSFEWIDDLLYGQNKQAVIRARYLVDRWIEIFGGWNAYAWDNDILAARLFNWTKHWTPVMSTDDPGDPAAKRRGNIERQLKRLRNTFGRTPPGMHRLRAAVSLALGGILVPGDPDKFLNRGLDWLDTEVNTQILADGGHISRSPAHTVQALHLLICLDEALNGSGIEPTRSFQRALERLHRLVPFFMYQDAQLACFNGSGQEYPSFLQALIKHAAEPAKPLTYCPHTGYQRISLGDTL